MKELEKILEEIGELRGQAGSECTSEDHYIKKAWEHCLDRVVGIIRKHLIDGWIPVEKDLPKNESEVWVVLESTYGTGFRIYSSARYLYFENYGEGHWCDEHYGYLEWDKYSDGRGGSSQYKVIAWRSIAPYRPERSNDEKE